MPLVEKIKFQGIGEVGIWRMTEDADFFARHPYIDRQDNTESKGLAPKRQREWLACRYLLYKILDQTDPPICRKDPFGKPYLEGSELEMSLSHSHDMAAVSISLFKNGVDIQRIVSKIIRIRHKYMHPDELNDLDDIDDLISLHIYWGAKECLYKAHGKRKLEFKHNIRIKSFNSDKKEGQTIGYVKTDRLIETFQINWKIINDEYILVFADQLL